MPHARILVTGAAGSLAKDIVPALRGHGHTVTCLDEQPGPDNESDWVTCSITDRHRLGQAMFGFDTVIHLAGIPLEADWATILRVNIDGTQAVLEAAHAQGVPRVILASSIHATGFTPYPDTDLSNLDSIGHYPGKRKTVIPDDVTVRPDTFYGVSKATLEALGSLYHQRHGMDVICLRIASQSVEPTSVRMLSTWLSPADTGRLFLAAVSVPKPGYQIVWGVSANTRSPFSTGGGESIGFYPEDDAEDFAPAVLAQTGAESIPASSHSSRFYIGGEFCTDDPPMHSSRSRRETDTCRHP